MMNQNLSQDFMFVPPLYNDGYTQVLQQQGGEPKLKRRRKRTKKASSENNSVWKKRKLSEKQVNLLELSFGLEHKLESERKEKLAKELDLDPRQVAVWFQNRRARWKNKTIEEEYGKMKSGYDNAIIENCHLQNEILKLKEKLSESELKIQSLTETVEALTGQTSSTSYDESEILIDVPDIYNNIWYF